VQGESAAGRIAAAIRAVGRLAGARSIDALLVTRGGGSREDLWAFNERAVAEAIVASPVPVVAAIGHETDVSIAELVADVRCATPTQAAVRLTPDREALLEQWASVARRLGSAAGRRASESRARVERAERRPLMRQPERLVADRAQRLSALTRGLETAATGAVREARVRVERARAGLARAPGADARRAATRVGSVAARLEAAMHARLRRRNPAASAARLRRAAHAALSAAARREDEAGRTLEAVGPIAVLRRGFTVTLDAQGRVVRSAEAAGDAGTLETRWADGSVRSRVEGAGNAGPTRPTPPAPPPRRRKPRRDGDGHSADQLGLF